MIEYGVDEVYCGFQFHSDHQSILVNRRPNVSANLKNIEELHDAVEIAHSKGAKLSITINSLYYTKNQYSYIVKMVEAAITAGVNAVIVSDLALILFLRENYPDLRLHLSTTSSVFNSESIKFFEELGLKRIILPRHLTIGEILKIKEKSTIDLEVFIFGQRCMNDDGQCTWEHGLENFAGEGIYSGTGCYMNYKFKAFAKNSKTNSLKSLERNYTMEWLAPRYCGFCPLFDFVKAGIKYFKIPGREEMSPQHRIEWAKAVNGIRKILENFPDDRDKYHTIAKEFYKQFFKSSCFKTHCYYPAWEEEERELWNKPSLSPR